jgi:hypothetical protein
MAALVAATHFLKADPDRGAAMGGRDKPGHDDV